MSKRKNVSDTIGVFCLASYHFWTLKIFELTNPQYFENPVTTGDYFLALTGGCGKTQISQGGDIEFVMPTMWLAFMLWILFCSLYYPFVDLQGIGKYRMVLSGDRGIWWISKCIWAVVNTAVNYLIVFFASYSVGICLGAAPSMQTNWYLAQELTMRTDQLTSQSTWNLWPIFGLTLFVLIAISLMQLVLSMMIKPQFAYLLIAAYLFAGAYKQSPVLIGNYAMAARSNLLVTTGLSPGLGALICLWIILISVTVGYIFFQRKDVLEEG